MPQGVGYPPVIQAQQPAPAGGGMSAMDRFMAMLLGQKPEGQPQSGSDELMLRQRGMDRQESQADAFRRLQQEQNAPAQPPADPNMIQRALGSLFGGR